MENEIDMEKKIKELDNVIFKVDQSAQTVHMLTKPQVFYDNAHKQALGYQNPFYLKKAQRIKPTLYDGIVISDKHVAMPVIDDEEALILEEIRTTPDARTEVNQVLEDIDAYRDEGMGDVIFGEPFLKEIGINSRWFDGMITIYNGNEEVTYQMVRSHPRFKRHTNEQCNKIPPLLKVSQYDVFQFMDKVYWSPV
ncbi:hypothetical protein Tco_0741295 [Tanacetum coccineum]